MGTTLSISSPLIEEKFGSWENPDRKKNVTVTIDEEKNEDKVKNLTFSVETEEHVGGKEPVVVLAPPWPRHVVVQFFHYNFCIFLIF